MELRDFETQLRGGRLTTAEVLYYMPDHPSLLQRFMWQTLDVAPEFPRVHRFLDFWRREIDAVIHSVNVSAVGIVAPARVQFRNTADTFH
ncbi:Usg family protein [Caulobacter sp. S45]|uniref:Usg family protein n=1 Tax=Caulobacter sp. S45 TaxID=1641861 RepID=UPI00131B9D41|nr:Usg family protein [Caulobacter sp. S45]